MQYEIHSASRLPIYQQLVHQVREAIARGDLKPEEQLPSVRQLSRDLVINPNTVARAYRDLESAGVVTTRRGAGTHVSGAGSPLDRRECLDAVTRRIDALLAEARQMNIGVEEIMDLIRRRDRAMRPRPEEE